MRYTLCTLFLLAQPFSAQALFDAAKPVAGHDFSAGVIVGESVCGNFTDDGLPDAVVRTRATSADTTGQLHLVYGPGAYNGVFTLPAVDVSSFDVAPGGAPNGLDALVVSVPSGIELWWIDDLEWTNARVKTGFGGNAPRLVVADLDASGSADIAGIAAGGTTVFCILDALGNDNASVFNLSVTAHDLQVLNWSAGDELELALLLDNDLQIVDRFGVQLAAVGSGGADWSIAVVQEAGFAYDRLGGVAFVGPNEYLFAWDYTSSEPLAWIVAQGSVSAVSADMDDDGRGDLIIPRVASQNLRMFANDHPTTPTFKQHATGLNNQFLLLGPDDPSPLNASKPVIDDFDLDGDPDVLLGDQLGSKVTLVRNTRTSHLAQCPHILGGSYEYNQVSDTGIITLDLDTAPYLGTATEYSMRVWTAVDGGGALSVDSLGSTVGPIASSGSTAASFALDSSILSDQVYWFDVRYLNPQTGFQTPPRIVAFVTTVASAAAIGNLPNVEDPMSAPIYDSETGGVLPPSQISGDTQTVVREVGELPCFENPDGPGTPSGTVPGATPGGS